MVSSVHLADGALPSPSDHESGLILACHALERWIMRCMVAAGEAGRAATGILVLQSCVHRERPKQVAGLCSGFGIEDTHLVIYAAKKLKKLISATQKCKVACMANRPVCEALLTESVKGLALDSAAASALRALPRHYDPAERAASAL